MACPSSWTRRHEYSVGSAFAREGFCALDGSGIGQGWHLQQARPNSEFERLRYLQRVALIDQCWKAEPQSGGGEFGAQTQTLGRSASTWAASKNAPDAPLGLVAPAIRAGLFIDHFHGEAAAVRTRKPVLESEVQDLLALGIDQSQAFPAIIEAADVLPCWSRVTITLSIDSLSLRAVL